MVSSMLKVIEPDNSREPDWFKRGVAEAIHIQRESPTLNRGRERHTLPSIYQELLPNCNQHTGSTPDPAVST